MNTRGPVLIAVGLVLAGCAGLGANNPSDQGAATRTAVPSATAPAAPAGGAPADLSTRTDDQGAVVFTATPLNLDGSGDTLDFDVTMNTHSVDVGWDLAARSVLRTDAGVEVQAVSWPVGSGHHYGGTLSFPASTPEGVPVLQGASVLTLVIRDTDVPERVFTWNLDS